MINNKFWKYAASSWSQNAKPEIVPLVGSGGQISEELTKAPWEVIEDDLYNESEEEETTTDPDFIHINMDQFDEYLESETIPGFIKCIDMLCECRLPEEITSLLVENNASLKCLDDAVCNYEKTYRPDLSSLIETYLPDTLNCILQYISLKNVKANEDILMETLTEIVGTLKTLLIAIKDKNKEIYDMASIETKANAMALNTTMNLAGHIDSEFKIK